MSSKAFIFFENKIHEVTFTSFTFQNLTEKATEVILNTHTFTSTRNFKITDNNHQDINNDQQVQAAFKMSPVFFFVHPIHNNNTEEKEKEKNDDIQCHNIVNPLVLLTGAVKYDKSDYLPGVKVDLMMLKKLFQMYGYDVHCTYDPDKPETEVLNLNQLNLFLMQHCINLLKANNNNKYDALIF
ncbi:hypothetical protein RFI_03479, partial [Reticulomyxa filosa]